MIANTSSRGRGERGNALVMVLVMVMVMGIAGAAVLNQESAAPKAQAAYADVRTVEIAVDNLANNLVHNVRLDPLAAVAASQQGRGTCSNDSSIGTPIQSSKPAGSLTVDVYCQADPNSGSLRGTAPNASPVSIMTLGGVNPRVLPYVKNSNLLFTPAKVTGSDYCASNCSGFNQTPNAWVPACNDFHDFQNSSLPDRCEAGFFIGRGVNEAASAPTDECTSPPCPGGLVVGTTGALTSGVPLVQSNSSIIVSQVAGVQRELDVEGPVWARAACGYGAGAATPGFADNVFAGYDPVTARHGVASQLHCFNRFTNQNPWATPSGPALTIGQNMVNEPLLPDPDYVHEPMDVKQMPVVNEYPSTATCKFGVVTSDASTAPLPRHPCSSNTCWDGAAGANTGSCKLDPTDANGKGCSNGFMIMPAKKLSVTQPALVNGVSEQHDVYVAWYDSAAGLNNVMASCPDTFFWFRPGIYYFDFQDVSGNLSLGGPAATKWESAKGCFPLTACGSALSELVGGTPPGWYPGIDLSSDATLNTLGWNPCVSPTTHDFSGSLEAVRNCKQPDTVLIPENTKPSNWWQNPAAGVTIDDKATAVALFDGTPSNLQSNLEWGALQTPLPQNIAADAAQNISSVSKFTFEVGYNLPGNQRDLDQMIADGNDDAVEHDYANYYVDVPALDDYVSPTKHGAEIQFTIQSNGDKCYIYVPAGPHGALDTAGPTMGAPIKINLLDGCNPAKIDPWNQGIEVDHVSGSFPCGTVADWKKITDRGFAPPACTGATTKDFRLKPDWIDRMKATFTVKAPAGTGMANHQAPGLAIVNGARYHVQWTGRPAPAYPGGCDRARPGVQWIFGGSSYIDWGDAGAKSMFAELCASRQDTFPNWDGDPNWTGSANCNNPPPAAPAPDPCAPRGGAGHDYGIAIYGTAPDGAGFPKTLDTKDTVATGGTYEYIGTPPDTTTGQGSGGPPWVDTTGPNAGEYNPVDNPPNTSSLMAAVDPASPRTNPISTNFVDAQWSTASLSFRLPNNIVGNGPNQIPQGALVNQVRAVVYHREGTVVDNGGCGYQPITGASWQSGNNGTLKYTTATPHRLKVGDYVNVWGMVPNRYNVGYATVEAVPSATEFWVYNGGTNPGTPTTLGKIIRPLPPNVLGTASCGLTNSTGDIKTVKIAIDSGIGPATASNAYTSGGWNSNANGSHVNNASGPPICTSYNSGGPFPAYDWTPGKNTETQNANSGCPFTWGNVNSVIDRPDSTGVDWSYQRDLTDGLKSVEALNNAKVTWSVTVAKNTNIKQLDLLGVRLIVSYRAVATAGGDPSAQSFGPRPVRGCTTTRSAWPNSYLLVGDNTVGTMGAAQAARGYDWLDPEWATQPWLSSATPMNNDDSYGNASANPGGTGPKGDSQDCALVTIDNGSGSRVKFHVSGAIYTPSAALALTANDNDSEWATDGIVSRQLSALKWKNNGDVPAVGNNPQPRENRRFTIYVCKHGSNCSAGNVLLKAVIVIDDQLRQNPGHAANTVSWVRNL